MLETLDMSPAQWAAHARATRVQPRVALDAIRRAIANPDDTTQVIRFTGAITGRSIDRLMKKWLRTPHGRELLERTPSLFDVLQDRERLAALPDGTFGRAYADWTHREQISAAGLKAEADAARRRELEPDGPFAALGGRLRDSHDLVHVATGYGRDLIGEVSVLAFSYGQTRHRGIGMLVVVGYLRSFFPSRGADQETRRASKELRARARQAYRAGRRADFFIGADLEALLPLPLDEVRKRYRIEPPPSYTALRTAGAPVLAAEDAVRP